MDVKRHWFVSIVVMTDKTLWKLISEYIWRLKTHTRTLKAVNYNVELDVLYLSRLVHPKL